MHAYGLRCGECGWEGGLELRYACPECGYSLEVAYDYAAADRQRLEKALCCAGPLWEYRELLPVKNKHNIVTLHEGGTPLIEGERIGKALGVHLLLKDETRNPTLSFKDRPNTVGISVAKEMGRTAIAIASTGNGAASLSAYAAKSGMDCFVFIPESTPAGKLVQALYQGAKVVRVPGDYSASFREACARCAETGWANLTSTYINPYTMEGDKTIAYELFAQMGGRVPDWVSVPLGAGPMLTGVLKGFRELMSLGFSDRIPRMLGVQAEGCAPIIRAFESGSDRIEPWLNTETVADAIADPLTGYERDGTRTVRSIRASGGYGVTVTDERILAFVRKLAREEAVFLEPASAASVAAVEVMREQGRIQPGETVAAILTAHGLKDAGELLDQYEKQCDGGMNP